MRPVEDRLGAEAAAEEGRADDDVFGGNAEIGAIGGAAQRHRLVRHVDRHLVAVPGGNHGMRLHGVVILRRRLVFGSDDARGAGKTGVEIAMGRARRAADADGRRRIALAAGAIGAGGLGRIAGRKQHGRFRRRLQRLGDDQRDRLVHVAHAVILQHLDAEAEGRHLLLGVVKQRRPVGRRHHGNDAGMGLRRHHIEEGHPAAGDGRNGGDGIEKAVRRIVSGIGGAAGHFQYAVAAGQRLAGIRAVAPGAHGNGVRRHGDLPYGSRRARRAKRASPPACLPSQGSALAQGCGAPVRS